MDYVSCEQANAIGIITINRPQALNALNTQVCRELWQAAQQMENDPAVQVVILTGAGGKAFVAGADIAEMRDMDTRAAAEFVRLANSAFCAIEDMTKPTIAAVEGFALGGGCELALACDIRVAGLSARFGVPETGLGIMPGIGGTQRLPRTVGKAKALEMIWNAKPVKAEEALAMGLISYITEAGAAMAKARELAASFMNKSQVGVSAAKRAVNYGLNTDIKTAIQYEIALFSGLFDSHDQKEGMTAFLEKRSPDFQNR